MGGAVGGRGGADGGALRGVFFLWCFFRRWKFGGNDEWGDVIFFFLFLCFLFWSLIAALSILTSYCVYFSFIGSSISLFCLFGPSYVEKKRWGGGSGLGRACGKQYTFLLFYFFPSFVVFFPLELFFLLILLSVY